jgi:hypothetical protein
MSIKEKERQVEKKVSGCKILRGRLRVEKTAVLIMIANLLIWN